MRFWAGLAAIAIGVLCLNGAQAGFRDDMFSCRDLAKIGPDAAIRSCRAAIGMAERAPELLNESNRADLWFHMALAYEAKNDHTGAIQALDGAIATYAGDRRFFVWRARQWQALGDFAKAIPDHTRAIQILLNPRPGYSTDKPMLFQAYMERGAAHEKLGNAGEAIKNYDMALAVYPGAEQAIAARGRLSGAQTAAVAPASPLTSPEPVSPPRASGPVLAKRVALIIGNTDYLYTNRLPNAVRDAEDVAAALKAKGYAIYGYPKVNMHREDIFAALDEFSKAAVQADIALVWYAGHGQQMNDPGEAARNWLFPVDFKGGTDLARGAIPLSKLLSAAQPAKALRVVVVDACRNTTLQSNTRNARGFQPERRDGMVVVYSTKEGELANDGDPKLRNSPFASAFLDALKVDGANDVRLFFGGVSAGVQQRTRHLDVPQQPELMSNLNTNKTLALAP
jgi:tetratricopeptide (TPR) repeat protein